MKNRELLAPIYLQEKIAVSGINDSSVISENVAAFAADLENAGADALVIFDLSEGDESHEETLSAIRDIRRATDLPLYGGGNIRRLEDVKKLIYAGCSKVFLNYKKEKNRSLAEEASSRFGRKHLLACTKSSEELEAANVDVEAQLIDGVLVLDPMLLSMMTSVSETVYCFANRYEPAAVAALLAEGHATGLVCDSFADPRFSYSEAKQDLKEKGIDVNVWESPVSWNELVKNKEGLIPVVVQDYRTSEVLMVAYMNKEAFCKTVESRRMTYFSRSRQELWLKGETSGHFQYLRELSVDCDNDTLLAKVKQIGAACHTGNKSCFYQTLLKTEYNQTNPMTVLQDVSALISDRKANPKEGSYTNYLFDKGIDKILKKVGEENAEIIIAAKNPNSEELIYEISDLLYHIMVLMEEKGLSWEDITEELSRR